MRKIGMIPALLLSLLLTACSMGGEEADSGRNSFWEALGVEATEPVLLVDGREVPAWRYVWWLSEGCAAMEEVCADSGMAADWDAPLETGTLADYVERQALADTVLYATVENWAAHWNVTAGVPEEDGLQTRSGIPWEAGQRQEMDTVGLLYRNLCALAMSEDSPLVSGEELDQFAADSGYCTVDQIVFAAEDREAARRQAEEAFGRLNNAADKGAMFEALSAGDGSSEALLLRKGESALWDAAAALEPGQYSGILETERGYCILRRLGNRRSEMAPLWVEWAVQQAAEEADVKTSPVMGKIGATVLMEAVLTGKND